MSEVVAAREAMQRQVAHQRGLLHPPARGPGGRAAADRRGDPRRHRAGDGRREPPAAVAAPVAGAAAARRSGRRPGCPGPWRCAKPPPGSGGCWSSSTRHRPPATTSPPRCEAAVRTAIGGERLTSEVVVQITGEPSPIVARALMRIVARGARERASSTPARTAVRVELREEPATYVLRVARRRARHARHADDVGPLHRGLREHASSRPTRSAGASSSRPLRGRHRRGGPAAAPAGAPRAGADRPDPRASSSSRSWRASPTVLRIDADWRYVYMNRAGVHPAQPGPGGLARRQADLGRVGHRPGVRGRLPPGPRRAGPGRGHRLPRAVGPLDLQPGAAHRRRLSIFARNVTEERRRGRLAGVGRDVVAAVTGPAELADALRAALEAMVGRLADRRSPAGRRRTVRYRSRPASCRHRSAGCPCRCPGRRSGTAELFGEVDPGGRRHDAAHRPAAGRRAVPRTVSTDRDGAERAEPETDLARSGRAWTRPS